jgi:hypothetical protein
MSERKMGETITRAMAIFQQLPQGHYGVISQTVPYP